MASRFPITPWAILLLLLGPGKPAGAQTVIDSLGTFLARGYSMVRTGTPGAEKYFEQAIAIDPSNAMVHKQLGYLYHSGGRDELAVQQFSAADSLQPSDTTKLQIAYWLSALNRGREAKLLYQRLAASPSPDIRDAAQAELDALSPAEAGWWTRIYASPYYDTRWETSFYQASLQRGAYLTDDHIMSAYGFADVSGDARSSGGLAPSLFSDNALILGLGLKVKPFTGFQASVQQGVAFDLIDRANRSAVRGDFRAAAVYGNGIYAPFTLHSDFRSPMAPIADLYSSVGYYSRFDNTIAYLQAKGGLRVLEVWRTVADAYLKGGLVRDTQKEYYNNIIEGALGARFVPNISWGLYLIGEYHRGYYLDAGDPAPPYDRYYNSFRLFIIFDQTF